MDDQELIDLERTIRNIMADIGLNWALTSLDVSISHGVIEEKSVDQYAASTTFEYDIVGATGLPGETRRRRGRPRTAIANRPQTVRERVLSLIDTLERVVIELPLVEGETLRRLFEAPDQRQAVARSIQFLPDEDMQDPSLRFNDRARRSYDGNTALVGLISALREEVLL